MDLILKEASATITKIWISIHQTKFAQMYHFPNLNNQEMKATSSEYISQKIRGSILNLQPI